MVKIGSMKSLSIWSRQNPWDIGHIKWYKVSSIHSRDATGSHSVIP